MTSRAHRFKENAAAALANPVLRANMRTAKGKFVDKRAIAIKEIDDFEDTREAAKNLRNKVLENLDKQGFHLQMPPAEEEYIEHLPDELLRMNDPL